MIKKFKLGICIVIAMLSLNNNYTFAQFVNYASGYYNTLGTVTGVGIGTNTTINSAFQIDGNTISIPTGEVFRTIGLATSTNAWRMFTGAGNGTEKGMIFCNADSLNFSIQASVKDLTFHTRPIVANSVGTERMRIVGVNRTLHPANAITTYPVIAGNVGIGTANPTSMLQIGGDVTGTGGYRDWMKIGTYYQRATDNMFIGIDTTDASLDATNAIINWGDNPLGNTVADRLIFRFTAPTFLNLIKAHGVKGVEIARMTTFGNFGMMGIGGDMTAPINPYWLGGQDPTETLEVNSAAISPVPGNSGLRLTDLKSYSTLLVNPGLGVLTVDTSGKVIYVPDKGIGALDSANNGLSVDTSNNSIVQLGNDYGLTSASLINNREVPLNGYDLIFTGPPDTYPGKVGFGIAPGNVGAQALRTTPTTMQVNGSISVFDGSGNSSVFFGEEQFADSLGTLGEWGIQYWNGSLNFWKPVGSDGFGFGNNFLTLNDNGNVGIGGTASGWVPQNTLEINSYAASPRPAGLKFKNLNYFGPITPFATSNFLTVDSTGNVILTPLNINSFAGAENGCSVDTNNKVVLGNDLGVASTPAVLLNDREIPMDKYNISFTEKGRIALGEDFTFGILAPKSKLDIRSDTNTPTALRVTSNIPVNTNPNPYNMSEFDNTTIGADFSTAIDVHTGAKAHKGGTGINVLVNTEASKNVGIHTETEKGQSENIGGWFVTTGSTSGFNKGVFGDSWNSVLENYGGHFKAGDSDSIDGGYSGINNYGVYAESWGGKYCYGVKAIAIGGTANNYGIYAVALPACDTTPPIGPNYAGYFVGDVVRTGDDNFTSDANLKENITNITNAISIIDSLKPHKFNFKTTEYSYIGLPKGNHFGLIAQEVELLLPELVKNAVHPPKYDSLGNVIQAALTYKTLNYTGFIPIIIQALKEEKSKNDSITDKLNDRIDSLRQVVIANNTNLLHKNDSLRNALNTFNTRLTAIEDRLEECCKGHNGNGNHSLLTNPNTENTTEVELENVQAIVLDQNVPNPFAESTVITYFIPDNINYAQIVFTDNYGRIMKTVDIKISGAGMIKVYAANLSSGTYTYSLMVDGKVVESKKMMCVK